MDLSTILEEQVNSRKGILLSEAYFGKSDKMVEASKQLDIIAGRIRKDDYYNPAGTRENKILEKCLEEQFNLESVTISWAPMSFMSNAFTFPISTMILTTPSSMDIKRTSSSISFKDKKGKHVNIFVFTGLVTVADVSGPELLAIILHEMGHNFYSNESYIFIKKASILSGFFKYLFKKNTNKADLIGAIQSIIFSITLGSRSFRKGFADGNKQVKHEDTESVRVAYEVLDSILTITTAVSLISTGVTLVDTLKRNMPIFRSKIIHTLTGGYNDEKFSDNFATIHGYGPELSSFIKKLNLSKNTLKATKIMNDVLPKPLASLLNAQSFIAQSIMSIPDCHPNNYTRVYDQAKLLRNELKNQNLDPRVKKQLMKDLENIESIYESMTKKEYFVEGNEEFKMFIYAIFKYNGRDRKGIKELLLPTVKDHDWESLKERKDRNKLKGMFLG